MMNSDNKKWLIIIAFILACIFIVVLVGLNQDSDAERIGNDISNLVENISEGTADLTQDVKDTIDENTPNNKQD